MNQMDDAIIELSNQRIISYSDVLTRVNNPEKLKKAKSHK
jgi:hypothetical protein